MSGLVSPSSVGPREEKSLTFWRSRAAPTVRAEAESAGEPRVLAVRAAVAPRRHDRDPEFGGQFDRPVDGVFPVRSTIRTGTQGHVDDLDAILLLVLDRPLQAPDDVGGPALAVLVHDPDGHDLGIRGGGQHVSRHVGAVSHRVDGPRRTVDHVLPGQQVELRVVEARVQDGHHLALAGDPLLVQAVRLGQGHRVHQGHGIVARVQVHLHLGQARPQVTRAVVEDQIAFLLELLGGLLVHPGGDAHRVQLLLDFHALLGKLLIHLARIHALGQASVARCTHDDDVLRAIQAGWNRLEGALGLATHRRVDPAELGGCEVLAAGAADRCAHWVASRHGSGTSLLQSP